MSYLVLPGNTRPLKKGATRLADANPEQPMTITVVLRCKEELPEPTADTAPLSITELEDHYGADAKTVTKVTEVLGKYGLKALATSPEAGTIEFEGTVGQMSDAFQVDLGIYETSNQGKFRAREGDIYVPAEVVNDIEAVLGLDERRVARRRPLTLEAAPAAAIGAQRPQDLEDRYSFPAGTANGQKVGILEFGGGVWDSDLDTYCGTISGRQKPQVTIVPVGLNSLSIDDIRAIADPQMQDFEFSASGEVNMDIQIIAGLCSTAELLVYFAPFTQKGWLDIINKVVHDPIGPKVVSVSWGSAEDGGDFTTAAITAINNALKKAALLGITICVSSGDDGVGDGVNDGNAHCDFPASSPFVLAVGGTMFPDGNEQGWFDQPGARTKRKGGGSSGGGRSVVFGTPPWQNVSIASLRTGTSSGRCIPDVAALSGRPLYDLIFNGTRSPNGGTSASAPLWASLIARINGNGRTIGFLTPKLYGPGPGGEPLGAAVTMDIAIGRNDVLAFSDPVADENLTPIDGYKCGPGYDAVTGWGVPNGGALQDAL